MKKIFFIALLTLSSLSFSADIATVSQGEPIKAESFNQVINKVNAGNIADYTGSNQSLGTNGYQKLPGGLIMQWGTTGNIAVGSNFTVTFPIAFPNACFQVQATAQQNSSVNSYDRSAGPCSKTGVIVFSNGAIATPVYWFAIGN